MSSGRYFSPPFNYVKYGDLFVARLWINSSFKHRQQQCHTIIRVCYSVQWLIKDPFRPMVPVNKLHWAFWWVVGWYVQASEWLIKAGLYLDRLFPNHNNVFYTTCFFPDIITDHTQRQLEALCSVRRPQLGGSINHRCLGVWESISNSALLPCCPIIHIQAALTSHLK